MTKEELGRAYEIIKQCIDFVLERDAIKFISSEIAPNNYKGMRAYRDDFDQFLVFSGGDHGYLGQEYNIKFRALHDAMHYSLGLSFKYQDEKKLSDITCIELSQVAWNDLDCTAYECFLVRQVINAEIRGQIEYYEKTNKYVTDQKKFMTDYLGIA